MMLDKGLLLSIFAKGKRRSYRISCANYPFSCQLTALFQEKAEDIGDVFVFDLF